jgi:hypothetical protein
MLVHGVEVEKSSGKESDVCGHGLCHCDRGLKEGQQLGYLIGEELE